MDKNPTTIDMKCFTTNEQKRKYYNELVYMIYGVTPDDLFFIDGNANNLMSNNIVITKNFI